MLKEKALGLTLGIFAAAIHFVWLLLVGLGVAKPYFDWMLGLHHVTLTWEVLPLNLGYAALLVLITFVGGYLMGYLFALLNNKLAK